jgi:PAS domain S-box-containing protein/putative nucleotidyltransferase with HDIG domain
MGAPPISGLAHLDLASWSITAINFLIANMVVVVALGTMLGGLVEAVELEQALEADYERLFNDNPIPMWVYDPDSLRFLEVNQAATAHYGYSRDEFLDMTIERIRPEEELERLAQNLVGERLPRERSGPWVHRKKDGNLIYVEIISHNTGFQGQPARLVQANDITERLRAEEQANLLSRAVEAAGEAMFLCDPTGTITYINPRFTQLYGYSSEEVVGKVTPRILKSGVQDDAVYEQMWGELLAGSTFTGEFVNQAKDGTLITVAVSVNPVRNERDEVVGFWGVQRDIRQRKQAEEQMRRRLQELEMVREVSSELRAVDSLDEMLPLLLNATLGALESELGSIWLYDPLTDTVGIRASRGYGSEAEGTSNYPPERPGEGLAGFVFQSNQPHLSQDLRSETRIPEEIRQMIPPGVGSVAVPIRADQNVIGVFIVNTVPPREAGQQELNVLTTIAEIAGNAIQRTRLHQETQRNLNRMVSLVEVNRAINSNLDLRLTLETVIAQVIKQLEVDAADVLLFNETMNQLEFAAGRGFVVPGFGRGLRIGPGGGLGGKVLAARKLVHLRSLPPEDMPEDVIADVKAEGFKTYIGVPLMAKGKLVGVLGIFQRNDLDPDLEWLSFLQSLASQASLAIDNAGLVADLQRSNLDLELAYDATIEGWSRAMDLRDRETEGHSQRVTELAIRLALRVGVKDERLVHLRRGALLHDIGKMGIPDEILHKPGQLTDAEWVGMRRHPIYARDMLSSIEYLQKALDIPYAHHEKWDGSGYPRGLKGEDIPEAARIFAVVDVYDALTSDRPYRKAWTRQAALDYIRQERGKHFDPAVADAFLEMIVGE